MKRGRNLAEVRPKWLIEDTQRRAACEQLIDGEIAMIKSIRTSWR